MLEQRAGQIPSPVLRLRFLRTVCPGWSEYTRWRCRQFHSWLPLWFLVVLLLLTTPTPERFGSTAKGLARPLFDIPHPAPTELRVERTPEIWQVEKTKDFETYSNGLRIDNRFSVATRRRSYLTFSATRPEDTRGERRSIPAGIVFHTTESSQAPFEPEQNARIGRIGESLLVYVRLKLAYNFLIDRFGRVYRVVLESDAANHAGYSIWSDSERTYLNLNESFLAVALETRTLPGQAEATLTPAQIRSAAMLTEMLRGRYGIPAGNCVTHGQVSVNASNLRIGYHIDWASGFPFRQMGLPDNYALPLPAVFLFGFEYDSAFAREAGARLYQEARLADQDLRDHAADSGLEVPIYRRALQKRYRKLLAIVHGNAGRVEEEE